MYQKNFEQKRNVDLLLIGEGEKTLRSYRRFQYIHSLHHSVHHSLHPGRKYCCRYSLHTFIIEEILK